ncbi:hypothetical protein [Teredinibacter purpureus]|uniref:hypothetical protein n=1 Tax=Teredinibacter purpureus TaxID=2731756 RepID=UPI0005F7F5BA|nr:hypothetical protein [Teredinibacter purpureus]
MLTYFSRPLVASLLALLVYTCPVAFAQNSEAETPPLYPPLEKHFGYLLIELDVGGIAPAIEYSRRSSSSGAVTLKLKGIDKRFLLLTAKKGAYHVTQVHAPLYDLPYRMDTKGQPYWQFDIEAGKINYFGKLLIEAERATDDVIVKRLNHLGKTLEDIQTEYAGLIADYPIVSAAGYRDDFYQALMDSSKEPL